ncbi:MAG: PT domain-containing protein, partial [Armatimonadia bacterium]
MRITSATAQKVIIAVLALLPSLALAQPAGPPEWLEKIDPTKYILLAANMKPPFAYGTDPQIEAQGQGTRIDDGQGHVTEQTVFFMYAMQTVKLAQPFANTAATNPPTAMRWDMNWNMTVGIYQNEEIAKAAVRTHYLSDFGPFTAEDENCLNDARLRNGRGAAGAMGRFVRYRNLILKIDTGNVQEVKGNRQKIDSDLYNGAYGGAQSHQQDLIAALARVWLDKVAGPDRADLHVEAGKVLLRWWTPSPNVEREAAADQQYVIVQVDNRSDKVAAVGAEARLLLAKQGDAEMQPVGRPVHVPDIPPGGSRLATFYWDLGGKSIENAVLRVEVAIPKVEDADMNDNQCDLKCSIYLAHNGTSAYRWVEDSYSFNNYGFTDREGQEMLEGILATVIGQVYTDPQASTLLTRLIFPQTYTRFMDYLQASMKEGIGGHCYGLAATAGLYFLDPSLRPGGGRTCDMTRDGASANVNLYQRAQMVPVVQALLSGDNYFERNWGPVTCLNTVRNILKTQRKPVILSIGGDNQVQEQVMVNGVPQMQQVNKSWGHALLAYKLVEVEGRPPAIYLYDPNIPPKGQWATQNPSTGFGIKVGDNTWFMASHMSGYYGGVNRIAAREVTREVSLAEANAVIPLIKAKLAEMMAWFDKAGKLMATLHCPADALFTDPQGRRVGMLNGKPINEVPGAEIRSSGEVEIYILPRDVEFSVQVTGTGAGQAGFDIIRSKGGAPEVVIFDKLPVGSGSRLQATLAKGGVLERITGEGGKTYAPTLTGTLQGDRVSWQSGSQQPTNQPTNQPTDQPTAVGELVVCRSVADGQAVGAGNSFPRLASISCLLRYQGLTPQTATC